MKVRCNRRERRDVTEGGNAMIRNQWIGRSAAAGAFTLGMLSGAMTPADAKPVEHVRFHEEGSEVIDDFCGDLQVRLDFHDQGVFLLRPAGGDRMLRGTATFHGGATYTNLATDRAFTLTWNYAVQEFKTTDNGDGTVTLYVQIPGPERTYGPDGQLLYTSGGMFRQKVTLDLGGTPDDPSDDSFVSEEFLSDHGGQPQEPFSFCDSFRTLTADGG